MQRTEDKHAEYAARQTATSLASLDQVLVNLTDANIFTLLSDAAHELQQPQRRAEATAVLAQLARLNPGMAGQFRLKENTLASIPLRMVCSPRPEFVPSFIAVSYCWHYSDWPLSQYAQPIVPGWQISLPMVHAIMGHRQSPDEGIWMDQLCINQDDGADKITHIGAMNIIYRAARRVVILFEDVELNADEQSAGLLYRGFWADLIRTARDMDEGPAKNEFIQGYLAHQENSHGLRPAVLLSIRSFALKMMGARWYSRAWCAHESRTAPHRRVNNPLLLCYGHDGTVLSFEFRFIFFLASHLSNSEPPETLNSTSRTTSMDRLNPTSLRQRWYRMIHLMTEQGVDKSPMQHIVSIMSFGCFKRGDLVSIALNTWGLPLTFDGELHSVEQAVAVFSLLVIASGDLTPLIIIGNKLRFREEGTRNEIVSWLMYPAYQMVNSRMPITLEGSITVATPKYVELDLLVFTSLPIDATPDSFQRASSMIEQHVLMDIHRDLLTRADDDVQRAYQNVVENLASIRPDRGGPLSTFHQRFLALALDCGLNWMLRFADVMEQECWTDWSSGTLSPERDPHIVDAAHSLLAHFNIQSDSVSVPPDYVNQTLRFLALLVDPRLTFLTLNPRRLPIGPGPSDFAIVPNASNRCWFAVPAAIGHLPAWTERVWVVERVDRDGNAPDFGPLLTSDDGDARVVRLGIDDTGTWQVKSRERIFAADLRPQTLLAGDAQGTQVSLLHRQRVYGSEEYDWNAARQVTPGIPQ